MKIRTVGAEMFHAEWRTDMTKLIVDFRNFANASKNGLNSKSDYQRRWQIRKEERTLMQ